MTPLLHLLAFAAAADCTFPTSAPCAPEGIPICAGEIESNGDYVLTCDVAPYTHDTHPTVLYLVTNTSTGTRMATGSDAHGHEFYCHVPDPLPGIPMRIQAYGSSGDDEVYTWRTGPACTTQSRENALQAPPWRAMPLTVWLGAGDDLFDAHHRNRVMVIAYGEDGNDTLAGGGEWANETCSGEPCCAYESSGTSRPCIGHDTLDGGPGDDLVTEGYVLPDSAVSIDFENHFRGGAGNDVLVGGQGTDKLRGGSGDDSINGKGAVDDIDGGRGNDLVCGGGAGDLVSGGEDDDVVVGDDQRGDVADDELDGGPGADQCDEPDDNGCEAALIDPVTCPR